LQQSEEKQKMRTTLFRFLGLLAVLSLASAAHAGDYKVINKLKLGGEGGWDYLTVDSAARRLYISRGTHVMVVDIDSNTLAGDIPATPGVHGIALAPEFKRGFTSNGKTDTSTIFDLDTLKVLGQVKTGKGPDDIIYDPASKLVFVFNGDSNDATAFDAASGTVTATIALGGSPEAAAADGAGHIYVNIADTGEVAEIDSSTLAVSRRFSLKPCEEPSGLGLDVKDHLVFSGCRNKIMTVLDTAAGKVIATVPIGKGVDGNGFDAGTGFAFSSNGDGTLTISSRTAQGEFKVIQTVATQNRARTMALDLKTHNVYLPAAEFEPAKEPQAPGEKRQRPAMIKDSFSVLVVGN
jgi:YVTN family beta-propeller protein